MTTKLETSLATFDGMPDTENNPEEWPLYRGYGMVALLDLFLPDAVVVFPEQPSGDAIAHRANLAPSVSLRLDLVVGAVSRSMLHSIGLTDPTNPHHNDPDPMAAANAGGWRIHEISIGRAVPDHEHRVVRLRNGLLPEPESKPTPAQLALNQAHWTVRGTDLAMLTRQLEVVQQIAPALDASGASKV